MHGLRWCGVAEIVIWGEVEVATGPSKVCDATCARLQTTRDAPLSLPWLPIGQSINPMSTLDSKVKARMVSDRFAVEWNHYLVIRYT